MTQQFINNTYYLFFVIALLFGLLLYGTIGFDGVDELCAFILIAFFCYVVSRQRDWPMNKVFLITLGVFLFYLGYSFYIGSNVKKAIVSDFIIQLKPYVAFFIVYQLCPLFDKNQKAKLRIICGASWLILLFLGVLSLFKDRIIFDAMYHVSYYYACVLAVSLIYFFCSDNTPKDKFIFILMLSAGLFSTRSKFYGIYLLAIVLVLFTPYIKYLKFNFKTVLLSLVVLAAIVIVGWQKIDLYFALSGDVEEVETGLLARLMLYMTSIDIFRDYFPFGSGLGSFASYSSGVYYSDIYAKYGVEKIYGMNSSDYSYIADTYYPCLAQFGVVGVILFITFFVYLIRKSQQVIKYSLNTKYLIIILIIIFYFLIESIADATFTGHRGFFMMMLLGLVFSEQKHESETLETNETGDINRYRNDESSYSA
ncbi:MAG: O-antigen ligase family protein [Tannerellaceae bacterium]|jgi:O-antigen ligase|nr:O-antigen ligase family protein [Tannerellaceae bacterium]